MYYRYTQISKRTDFLNSERDKYLALPIQGGALYEESSTDYKHQVSNNVCSNPHNSVVNLHVNAARYEQDVRKPGLSPVQPNSQYEDKPNLRHII